MSEAEIKIVGYCRTCGTGLDEVNLRTANGTIYCAEHLPPPQPEPPSPYTAPPPPPSDSGSPGAAFVLGMIPGVGAIYNGQYAKGIVHVIIVALLIMAADNSGYGTGPLFGLLIPGFWFYMAFEAYHTARRKREGLPVDEFSGLGLGERNSRFPIAAVLLIGFGTIFLLNNLGIVRFAELMQYWPVGMIALGLYMLVARMKQGGGDEPR
jgi:hypothetical protein